MSTSQSAAPSKRLKTRKVLLMGKSGAGKSSMRSIVFNNYIARDVRRLGATIDVEHSNIRFMGNLTLNLWDCGGQDGFMENYLSRQREHVFSGVAVLIFVFDVESREFPVDLEVGYADVLKALREGSPQAKVFVLIHKMDLVGSAIAAGVGGQGQISVRERIFEERAAAIRKKSEGFEATLECFPTSIWDQSLYKAWTQIIHYLIPNAIQIEELLGRLADAIDARELILYERTTCLTVTSVTRGLEKQNPFYERFEQLASILKTHKQSLAKHTQLPASSANFADIHIKTPRYAFFITRLTENTNIAVTLPPSEQAFNAARLNVALARSRFMELDIGGGRASKTGGITAPAAGTSQGGSSSGGDFLTKTARDISSSSLNMIRKASGEEAATPG